MARKILFRHMRAPGDVLMMSCGIRDFKHLFPEILINVECNKTFDWIFDNNPYLDRSIKKGDPDVDVYDVGYPQIQGCNDGSIHFTQAFLFDMISHADAYHKKLGMSIGEFSSTWSGGGAKEWGEVKKEDSNAREPFITWRKKYKDFTKTVYRQYGDLHLTESERNYNPIKELYGVGHYWIVAPGGKRDCTCKIWDWRKFQAVTDYFKGRITFVSIGRSDHLLEKLDNVIDMTDKTSNMRDLVPLFYHATGVISGVSFPMHLAAAMPPNPMVGSGKGRKPCVAIYGGREPTSFTWYCNHQILHTNGAWDCCDSGGCWQSRIVPIHKDPEANNRMCHCPVEREGRTIQGCMDSIKAEDVIRAIEKYYEGNIYKYDNRTKNTYKSVYLKKEKLARPDVVQSEKREINFLASLQGPGGGEQSACMIAKILRNAGWRVNFFPWDKVHKKHEGAGVEKASFKSGMQESMKPGLPLLFYGNDQVNEFCKESSRWVVDKSSAVAIGINFVNGDLPRCGWIAKTRKLKGVITQNEEKSAEFIRDAIGFENTKVVTLFGAISLDRFYETAPSRRGKKEPLVILKHCMPDYRKYVTDQSFGNGQKIHVWQRRVFKEKDVAFYKRLLDDCKFDIQFEFMEAHPELIKEFSSERRMVFHKWDSMKVTDFLKRGHVYLYRTSNLWRDQYPRCVAEALAVGMPVLTEPRDGTMDRVIHGDTGFHCVDYDQFLEAIKKLHRKEDYRMAMGLHAKEWANKNLDPKKWVQVLGDVFK